MYYYCIIRDAQLYFLFFLLFLVFTIIVDDDEASNIKTTLIQKRSRYIAYICNHYKY
jgi:hypothetical protein